MAQTSCDKWLLKIPGPKWSLYPFSLMKCFMVRAQWFRIWDQMWSSLPKTVEPMAPRIQCRFTTWANCFWWGHRSMAKDKESFRVLLFLDRNHEGFGREDHRTFCRFFKLRFRAKEHKTCLCESCSINIGCVKKNGCSPKFDVPISWFLQKNKLRTLGYDNIDP